MTILETALIAAAFLCTLVAGFLFAFSVVVMPGIRRLEDAEFLRAFQAMDGVIQRGQPLFVVVWVGSAIAVIAAAAMTSDDRAIVIGAAALYLLGVQLPTAVVNIPLNNRVQRMEIRREEFEGRWNRSNVARTWCACAVSVLLLVALSR
jgi:uncharacterized membrane protein